MIPKLLYPVLCIQFPLLIVNTGVPLSLILCFSLSNFYLFFNCICVNPASVAAIPNKRFDLIRNQPVSSLQCSVGIKLHSESKCFDDLFTPICIGKHMADLSRFKSFFLTRSQNISNLISNRVAFFWIKSLWLKSNLQMSSPGQCGLEKGQEKFSSRYYCASANRFFEFCINM